MSAEIITESSLLEELIAPYKDSFPRQSDFLGYRGHCLRMLNIILRVSQDEPDRRQKTEIALAFHDITVFPARTLDYLDDSSALARDYLASIGKTDWAEQVTLMITQHHKITPYRGRHANLVEAMRKADWVDVGFALFKFGIDRAWLRQMRAALPVYTFYPRTLFPVIGAYILKHPLKPLPNFRW